MRVDLLPMVTRLALGIRPGDRSGPAPGWRGLLAVSAQLLRL
jgi:hypothetical protein